MKEQRDDRKDTKRLNKLVKKIQKARANGNHKALAKMDRAIEKFLDAEARESRKEIKADAREIAQADDRAERRDEVKDLKKEVKEADRRSEISVALRALIGSNDDASVDAKIALLEEMVRLQKAEQKANKAEAKEDRKEVKKAKKAKKAQKKAKKAHAN